MDGHLFLVLFLGTLSGVLTPLAVHFVFKVFNVANNLAMIVVGSLPKLFFATVLAIVAVGIAVLGPLYLFRLIPLLDIAPFYGFAFLLGGVLSTAIFWRNRGNECA